MKKMFTSLFVLAALSVLMAVPVLAGPAEEFAADAAAAEQRCADYIAYQENLLNFQAGEIARGEAQRAQLRADYDAY